MNLVIRDFSNVSHQVSSHLSSSFIDHSTAEGTENFLEVSSKMKMSHPLQGSMDGPIVNCSFLKKPTSNHDVFNTTVFLLGSCGLHIINGTLKTDHETLKWIVRLLLHSLYKPCNDRHAHRAD